MFYCRCLRIAGNFPPITQTMLRRSSCEGADISVDIGVFTEFLPCPACGGQSRSKQPPKNYSYARSVAKAHAYILRSGQTCKLVKVPVRLVNVATHLFIRLRGPGTGPPGGVLSLSQRINLCFSLVWISMRTVPPVEFDVRRSVCLDLQVVRSASINLHISTFSFFNSDMAQK